jgi:hypothetical protein
MVMLGPAAPSGAQTFEAQARALDGDTVAVDFRLLVSIPSSADSSASALPDAGLAARPPRISQRTPCAPGPP